MSKSLQASPSGIEQAKRALLRKNLTQRAVANELGVASWATVSKFFTGKPVSRFIFIDICDALDLDWETVAISPDVPDAPASPPAPTRPADLALSSACQAQSTAARQALTPRILERIPRSVVQEQYLVAIQQSLSQQPQIIPIVAPAGYGKTTILGDLYDQLTAAGVPWIGVILCSTVSLSSNFFSFLTSTYLAATFMPAGATGSLQDLGAPTGYQTSAIDGALGQSLTGLSQSLTTVTQTLCQTRGRGVLLIDTLDLLINRDFVPIFSTLLGQLLEQGVTVVFTCRDHEYSDYLEPVPQRLIGLVDRVKRQSVPDFTTAEIRLATATFFNRLDWAAPEQGDAFAEQILALSADNRSLREIIQNPLLLALLCDLFAQAGKVPSDLTVSKLYQRYWNEKIAYSRIESSDTESLAIAKDDFCLTMARRLFELSHNKLCESLYRDDLNLEFTKLVTAAYNDLLSEGVLDLLPSRKLHFFHQTLLEYAIAYWLTRHSAQPERHRLLNWMQQPDAGQSYSYWLPVLRQHLTLVESAEFTDLVAQLDIQDLGLFNTIALAAASREQPEALAQFLPLALKLGQPYQERLRQALASAPPPLIQAVWPTLLSLLQQANHTTAIHAANLAGVLLGESWTALQSHLPSALEAITQRFLPSNSSEDDEQQLLFEALLQPCG
ncbi:MAG: hypothetical protein ACKO7W_18120, partial [Elainella sp.]